jgi:hypothetical protein
VYDHTYIDRFLETNRDSLPLGFSRASIQTIQNCPDALVEVRLIVDPAEDTSHAEPKNVLLITGGIGHLCQHCRRGTMRVVETLSPTQLSAWPDAPQPENSS